MKISSIHTFILATFMAQILFSCSKENNDCPSSSNINISVNKSVIYPGNSVSLSTNTAATYIYKWNGPGGRKSTEPVIHITNIQPQDAGEYTLKIFSLSNCLLYQGATTIILSNPPVAPCVLPENAINSNLNGIGSFTFSFPNGFSAYSYNFMYWYYVWKGDENFSIAFSSSTPPETGIYKTQSAKNEIAFILLQKGAKAYKCMSDNEIYVTVENGQKKLIFCDMKMYEVDNYLNQFLLSGKMDIR